MHSGYGKRSCGLFVAALTCLLGVAGACGYMAFAPPTGGGEFRGINHFAAFCVAALCYSLAMLFSLLGLLSGLAGLRRDQPRGLATAGALLNGVLFVGLSIAFAVLVLTARGPAAR